MKLEELERELESLTLPKAVRLSAQETCYNPKELVKTHLSILKHNSGNRIFKPYYDRLIKVYEEAKKEVPNM